MRYGTVLQRRIALGYGKWTYQYVMYIGPSPKGGPTYETFAGIRLNDVGSTVKAGQLMNYMQTSLFEVKP